MFYCLFFLSQRAIHKLNGARRPKDRKNFWFALAGVGARPNRTRTEQESKKGLRGSIIYIKYERICRKILDPGKFFL